jgi:two-component system, response regulator, stage 0 sporulation protein F
VRAANPLSCFAMQARDATGSRFASWGGVSESLLPSVLIVEDEQCIRDVLVELFGVEGSHVEAAESLQAATSRLARRAFDLIVTDIRLGGRRDGGLQVMAAAGVLSPDATVVVLTAYPDEDNRLASFRLGATHFLEKPVSLETIATLASAAGVATAMQPVVPARAGAVM